MTREEALAELNKAMDEISLGSYTYDGLERSIALEMAINALRAEPCDDVVSRQAVLNEIDDTNRRGGFGCKLSYTRCRVHIEQLPPVRPQEQTGHWIKSKDGYMRCDQCGSRGSAIKARFCHHCGAKMESEG